jgi:hypothetical protein
VAAVAFAIAVLLAMINDEVVWAAADSVNSAREVVAAVALAASAVLLATTSDEVVWAATDSVTN